MQSPTKIGSKLYAIFDKELGGFLTWIEKGCSAIFLFTTSEKAERYINEVGKRRPLVVYLIHSSKARGFIDKMLSSNIEYALIDVPPEHADVLNVHPDEVVRNYALVDLRLAKARLS